MALGQHAPGALPTVEELTDLIADVEVRTFIGPTDVDDDLLRAGWYLHGVASASAAAELYSPARQQRAFAISAHIFDLALSAPDRTSHDQLTLAFGAQVGYRRSDLDPNATAIWRRVDPLLDSPGSSIAAGQQPQGDDAESPNPNSPEVGLTNVGDTSTGASATESLMTMSLRAGVAFLGLDVARVGQLLRSWRSELTEMTQLIGTDSLSRTMFGPAEAVASAVADLMTFLRYGDRERLQSAEGALTSVVDLTAGAGDHDARWVAAHLLSIADGIGTSSVWSVLPDGSPDAVAQAFTVGTPPVLTLWPPQRDLLQRATANPLDPATKRLLLSVPTSAGKTLVAQILMCHHLATEAGDICYVTPLRSLGREMRQALAGRLRVLEKGLGGDQPDFGEISIGELFDLPDASAGTAVEVMTPERLAHLLRHSPEEVLGRFSMFVIDEAHLLAQPGRGFLLESLLSVLANADARLILLSGVMGNGQQVATWLDPSEPDVLFTSSWRGPRRLHALLHSKKVDDAGEQLPALSKTFTHRIRYPMIAQLSVRPAEGKVANLTTSPDNPIGEMMRSVRSRGQDKLERTPFYRLCAKAAENFLPAGSLLMILSRRDYARNAAQEMAERLESTSRTDKLREFLQDRLGEEHPLIGCVRHGVAYHHAGLPVDVLDALEQAIRSDVLRAIFATSTLTDGVNLPVKTVLICETRYEGQDPGQQLDAPRLLNAVGRAGRAGRETEGWIILGLNQKPTSGDFDILQPAAADLEIRSTLDSEHALSQLAEAEALVAETADALFEMVPGPAAEFATFVWFVLSATERLTALGSAVDLGTAIYGLLAFVQLPKEIKERWIAFADYVREQFDQTPPASRLRWTVTGAGLRSARIIEYLAASLADHVIEHYGGLDSSGTTGSITRTLTLDEALTSLEASETCAALLALTEAHNLWRFKPTVGAKTTIDVSLMQALRGWLAGLDMPALAAHILPTVSDAAWRLEQTVDAVSGTFEHFLSWTIGLVAAQANDLLVERGSAAAIPEDLAYLIRYGVDTTSGVKLMAAGVRSRRIAHEIGRQAQSLGLGWSEVREWLRALHIDGWRQDFAATSREVEDLAEFCRTRAKSPIRQLLENHITTVDLADPMTPVPPSPLAVELKIRGSADPVEIWNVGSAPYRVGTVAAAFHADLHLLSNSGIEYSATTDGTVLTLYERR
ncbi:DEAD/DEAH box helicase [Mycolicibacterium septicum]|nr:DEAD/DEAH box helicase [Mycolicibacterium septicum]